MKVRAFEQKRVFVEIVDKKTGKKITIPVVRKSVILENGTTVKWNKRGECWSIKSAPRWSSAVTTSLQTRAMVVAHEKGRLRSDTESYFAFSNFQTRMLTMVSIDDFVSIVTFLGGK